MSLLQRIHDYLAKPSIEEGIMALYGQCVTQARQPAFYQAGVPDTVEGRFDLIVLHVYLVMRQLDDYADAKQQLFDLMFGDMDRSLREMGVGDMSIRKKMRPMISAFYGRGQAYETALASSDAQLSEVLQRNIFGTHEADPQVLKALTGYVRTTNVMLDQQSAAVIVAGTIAFPKPSLV